MLSWRLVRVAAAAAAIAGLLYLLAVTAVDLLIVHSEIATVDARLEQRLGDYQRFPPLIQQPIPSGGPGQPLIWSWLIGPGGQLEGESQLVSGGQVVATAPALPPSLYNVSSPGDATLAGEHFRIAGGSVTFRQDVYHVVVGESLAPVDQITTALAVDELIAGIPILVLVFLGAWLVAYRSVRPVEEARRRQLAFTADASHELRTPLTVIEAEASLALTRERDPAAYQDALRRITSEAGRLRSIVEDLLFLARFDSQPPEHGPLVADAAAVSEEAAARFQAPAAARGQNLRAEVSQRPLPVPVPREWLERVLGVLLDNACRYTPDGGSILVSAGIQGDRIRIQVDDSGPGISAKDGERIFDRFHRANAKPGGAGLGLAIADAVVRATGGRWEIGVSPLGGARFAVQWPAQGTVARAAVNLPAQA